MKSASFWMNGWRSLCRPWHVFRAWRLSKTIRRQRHELAKYVRRSAYEIAAWRQDIGFLTDRRDFHLERAGTPPPPDDSKVVSIETLSFPKERAAFRHIAPS